MPRYQPWTVDSARRIIAEQAAKDEALLRILHAFALTFGHVPHEAVELIAQGLALSTTEVRGAIAAHGFRRHAPAEHIVSICQGESCLARGAAGLAAHAERRLGMAMEKDAPGRDALALEPSECLGLCEAGPSVMIDNRRLPLMTEDRFDQLADEMARRNSQR